jgi:hypothetical protein
MSHTRWRVTVTPDGERAVCFSMDDGQNGHQEIVTVSAAFTCDADAYSFVFAAPRIIVVGDALGRLHFLSIEPNSP